MRACSILGYAFVPRIRDLPSKRLYVFERAGVLKHLRPLVGGKVNANLIDRNWADILRVAATMADGTMRPSQNLRKLAAYPRQNELAAALREVGRIERSLFMIDWTTDPGMRRRAQVGLNKGEAHHAVKQRLGNERKQGDKISVRTSARPALELVGGHVVALFEAVVDDLGDDFGLVARDARRRRAAGRRRACRTCGQPTTRATELPGAGDPGRSGPRADLGCAAGRLSNTRAESFTKSTWDAIRSDEMAEIGLSRP